MSKPIDLTPFLGKDTDEWLLSRPWMLDDGRIAASDRVVIVAVSSAVVQPKVLPRYPVPKVTAMLARVKDVRQWCALPEPVECKTCGNTGVLWQDCYLCRGKGECTCERCDATHPCGNCDGERGYHQDCVSCIVTLGTRRLFRAVVDKFRTLANVEWGVADDDPNESVCFRFEGGSGLAHVIEAAGGE